MHDLRPLAARRSSSTARSRPDLAARAPARWCCCCGPPGARRARRTSVASASARIVLVACSRWSPSCGSRSARADGDDRASIAVDSFRWARGHRSSCSATVDRDRARRWTTTRAKGSRRRDARARAVRDGRHDDARRGARPHDRVPRHRADVDRGVRAGRHEPAQRARRPRARSSTSCSARSRRRSCSTASRSCTARRARRTSP